MILVTGASGHVGRELVERLAAEDGVRVKALIDWPTYETLRSWLRDNDVPKQTARDGMRRTGLRAPRRFSELLARRAPLAADA